jgi:hypothetical protein
MPRLRVIILEKPEIRDNTNVFRYVFWADVPAARQAFYARPGAVSAWKDALTADNTNIANGTYAEKVDTLQVAAGTGITAMQVFLQDKWTAYQADVTALNPWVRYGSTWDGTTWTVTGAA